MTNGIVIGLSLLAGVWLGWYALPICLAVLAVVRLIERNPRLRIFVICALFAVFGALRTQQPPTETMHPDLQPSTGAIGRIVSFPRPIENGHRVLFDVDELCLGEQCVPADALVLVNVPDQRPPVSKGLTASVSWEFQPLQDLPPSYRNFVSSQGAEGQAYANAVRPLERGPALYRWLAQMNATITSSIQDVIPGDAGALATGIITGDDSLLSPEAEEWFLATGTSHITAVSGQNVSIIIGFVALWFHPKRESSRWAFHLFLIGVVWVFTLLVGMEAPAVRAAIVATLTILGRHTGRRPDPLTLLTLTLGAMALVQPLVVHTVGFWLSAVASMALCMVLPTRISRQSTSVWFKIAAGPCVASIATLPISLASFGVWSPIGIVANILVAPVMALAFPVTYGFALLALFAPGVAEVAAVVPSMLLRIVLVIVESLAPLSTQIRVDTISAKSLALLWIPIAIGIWLFSDECRRWIRRVLTTWVQKPKIALRKRTV